MSKFSGLKDLERHKVESSNLDWVAYDAENEYLYVGFLNGGVYAYEKVPQDIFDGLLNAGSHGRYFWVKIRKYANRYPYTKLR